MKKSIIAVIAIIVVAAATIAMAFIFGLLPPVQSENDGGNEGAIESNTYDNSTLNATNDASDLSGSSNRMSTTTTTIENDSDYDDADNGPSTGGSSESSSNIYDQSQDSAISFESQMQMKTLDNIGRDVLINRAESMVTMLRNYDQARLTDTNGWKLQFAGLTDDFLMKKDTDGNILAQELDERWMQYGQFPEWQAYTTSVTALNTYMDTIDGVNYPAVGIITDEYHNADYPYFNSKHWKPMNHVTRTYIVHFSQDGSQIWRVKSMDETVLEENVNGVDLGSGRGPHDLLPES